MIKINLLKNITALPSRGAPQTSISLSQVDKKEVALRLVLIFAAITVLIIYEAYQKNILTSQQQRYRMELQQHEQQIVLLGPEIASVEKFIKEKKNLEKKFEIIGQLASKRLVYVKAMDALQTLLPEKAWFLSVKFDKKNLIIKGKATEDGPILDFVKGLEENIFFTDVVLTSSVEVKTASGVIKEFEIICVLEQG